MTQAPARPARSPLARAGTELADLAGAWVKVVLTDRERPLTPLERLREKWPHTIALDFDPEGGLIGAEADVARVAAVSDPAEICGYFVEYVAGAPPDAAQRAALGEAVEAAQRAEDEPLAAAQGAVPLAGAQAEVPLSEPLAGV